jgi:hypothetical protein
VTLSRLPEAKRQMQAGHQATLKVFDKQGAKAMKPKVILARSLGKLVTKNNKNQQNQQKRRLF